MKADDFITISTGKELLEQRFAAIVGYREKMCGVIEIRGCEPPFIVVRVLEAKNKEVRCHVSVLAELEKLGDDVGGLW
ncbi:hypothetical protein Tco_0476139 [Tanacetum coccineum]